MILIRPVQEARPKPYPIRFGHTRSIGGGQPGTSRRDHFQAMSASSIESGGFIGDVSLGRYSWIYDSKSNGFTPPIAGCQNCYNFLPWPIRVRYEAPVYVDSRIPH